MSSTLLVAAAQYPLDRVADFDAWANKALTWVADGAATGAGLLVFPEYGGIELAAAAGGNATADLAATLSACADMVDRATQVWADLARRHGVHILAPSGPERRGGGYVNAARLHAPSGASGVQDKLILTPFERDWGMTAGSVQQVFDTAIGRIGVAICYDSEFPLLVRALTEAGAQIILIPACTEHESGHYRVQSAARARALESQVATVTAPIVGAATWSAAVDHNCGAAGIFVPPDIAMSSSGVLAQGRLNEPGWTVARIDIGRLNQLRETGEMRNWADWSLQRGAAPLASRVGIVPLV